MTPPTKAVAFIIGWGKGVGSAVANKFLAEGYSVAVASRSLNDQEAKAQGFFPVKLDASKPSEIEEGFDKVEKLLGSPSVVVYNAFSLKPAPPSDPLSLSFADFLNGVNVTGLNAYLVAHKANQGFDRLGNARPRTFIATGNILPWVTMPPLLSLGVGKRALAHIVEASAQAYDGTGKNFYYVQQVTAKGGPMAGADYKDFDPEGHATAYYRLSQQSAQAGWDVRFVKGGDLYRQ